MCVHFKLKNVKNITGEGFQFCIESVNKTNGTKEYFYSRRYFGNYDWKKVCHNTGIIQRHNNDSDRYYFGFYSLAQKHSFGDIYVDDISLRRINFRIGINNDRDEVYDKVNVVYQINGYKGNYNLTDFELTTNIKDDTNKSDYNEKIKIPSLFFTKSISMKNKLKDGNFIMLKVFYLIKKIM